PLAHGPGDLLLAALALDRLEDAGREAEQIRDRFVLAADPQLLDRFLDRIVVGYAGGHLHHLGDRPVRDAFAVGQSSAGEDRGSLDSLEEIAREPALADAGLAVDREDVRAAVARDAGKGVVQEIELLCAAYERRPHSDGAPLLVRADDAARPDRAV